MRYNARPVSAPPKGRNTKNRTDKHTKPIRQTYTVEAFYQKRVKKGKIEGDSLVRPDSSTPAEALSEGVRKVEKYLINGTNSSASASLNQATARAVLFTGLLQARAIMSTRRKPRIGRTQRSADAYQILKVAAIRSSKRCLEESDKARRKSARCENEITARALLEESYIKGKLAGDIKKYVSEAKLMEMDIRASYSYLKKRLEEVEEDWVE